MISPLFLFYFHWLSCEASVLRMLESRALRIRSLLRSNKLSCSSTSSQDACSRVGLRLATLRPMGEMHRLLSESRNNWEPRRQSQNSINILGATKLETATENTGDNYHAHFTFDSIYRLIQAHHILRKAAEINLNWTEEVTLIKRSNTQYSTKPNCWWMIV